MKVIKNNFIPWGYAKYINLFGVIFTKSNNLVLTQQEETHEGTHTLQGKYLLWIFFYLIYFIEWLIKIPISIFCNCGKYGIIRYAYRSISFEQQAYYHQYKDNYLENANPYEWIKYIFKMYKINLNI